MIKDLNQKFDRQKILFYTQLQYTGLTESLDKLCFVKLCHNFFEKWSLGDIWLKIFRQTKFFCKPTNQVVILYLLSFSAGLVKKDAEALKIADFESGELGSPLKDSIILTRLSWNLVRILSLTPGFRKNSYFWDLMKF